MSGSTRLRQATVRQASAGTRGKSAPVGIRTLNLLIRDRLACELAASEIEEQLKGASASVHNAFLRYLRAVFNFCDSARLVC